MLPNRNSRTIVTALAALAVALVLPPDARAATPLQAVLSADATGPNTSGDARVRVAHLSPDAPAVDVLVDGAPAFTGISFGEVTGYAALPPGTYDVQVEPAGAGGAGPFVIEAALTLAAGTDYTVVATDVLAEIFPTVLVDDNAAPAAGEARVRFFHGSPDAPAVDVAVTGGPVLFGDVAFGESGGYLAVPAGTYDLEVRVAGTPAVALTLPGVALEAGNVYTAYAAGLLADGQADRSLFLEGERFRVEVAWTDFFGNSGFGRAVQETDDTGFFWFFNDQNIELVTKLLDGCGTNGFYWFFYGALSNVGYEIRVTDTQTDVTQTYTNPLGTFASSGATTAFPCP